MFSTTYFCGYICGYIMDIFLCVFLPQLVQFFMQTIFARWKTHCSCTKTPSKVANLFLYATRVDNNLKDYVLFFAPNSPNKVNLVFFYIWLLYLDTKSGWGLHMSCLLNAIELHKDTRKVADLFMCNSSAYQSQSLMSLLLPPIGPTG